MPLETTDIQNRNQNDSGLRSNPIPKNEAFPGPDILSDLAQVGIELGEFPTEEEILRKYGPSFHLLLGMLIHGLVQDLLVSREDDDDEKRMKKFRGHLNHIPGVDSLLHKNNPDSSDNSEKIGLGDLLFSRAESVAHKVIQQLYAVFLENKATAKIRPQDILWLSEIPFSQRWTSVLALQTVLEDTEIQQILEDKKLIFHPDGKLGGGNTPGSLFEFAQAIILNDSFQIEFETDVSPPLNPQSAWELAHGVLNKFSTEKEYLFAKKHHLVEEIEQLSVREKLAIFMTVFRGGYYHFATQGAEKFSVQDFNEYIASFSARADLVGFYPLGDADEDTQEMLQEVREQKKSFLLDFSSADAQATELHLKLLEKIRQRKIGVSIVEMKVATLQDEPQNQRSKKRLKSHLKDLAHTVFASFEFLTSLSRSVSPLGEKQNIFSQDSLSNIMHPDFLTRKKTTHSKEFQENMRSLLGMQNNFILLEIETPWLEKIEPSPAMYQNQEEKLGNGKLRPFRTRPLLDQILNENNVKIEPHKVSRSSLLRLLREKINLARQIVFGNELKETIKEELANHPTTPLVQLAKKYHLDEYHLRRWLEEENWSDFS